MNWYHVKRAVGLGLGFDLPWRERRFRQRSGGDVYVGVAVLGTSLSEGHKRFLSQFSTAIVALDPDALPKTLQFTKELRGHVNNVHALKLKDDLKYKDPNDIERLTTLGVQHGTIINT